MIKQNQDILFQTEKSVETFSAVHSESSNSPKNSRFFTLQIIRKVHYSIVLHPGCITEIVLVEDNTGGVRSLRREHSAEANALIKQSQAIILYSFVKMEIKRKKIVQSSSMFCVVIKQKKHREKSYRI